MSVDLPLACFKKQNFIRGKEIFRAVLIKNQLRHLLNLLQQRKHPFNLFIVLVRSQNDFFFRNISADLNSNPHHLTSLRF